MKARAFLGVALVITGISTVLTVLSNVALGVTAANSALPFIVIGGVLAVVGLLVFALVARD